MTAPTEAPAEGPLRYWYHSRKGRVVGVKMWESDDGETIDVSLVGEHDPQRMYRGEMYRAIGAQHDGDVLRMRVSLLTVGGKDGKPLPPEGGPPETGRGR